MRAIYISQDGRAPSGISTYGFHLLAAWPDAQLLLLNASEAPLAAPGAIRDRIHCVPEAESHDVLAISRQIEALARAAGGEVVVLPNTGDTAWSGTVEWTKRLTSEERARVRVLGIVHSDVETQYSGAVRHAMFAGAWIGVSRRCAEELRQRLPGTGREVRGLPYPMAVPERASEETPTGPLRIVYAGRLEEPQKRVSRLAAVLSALVARKVSFSATIAGDGPARAEFAAALSVEAAKRVRLTGMLDPARLAEVLAEGDVFLMTSVFEGLPLALLEAMAAGLCPVVMRIASGLDDVMRPGEDAVVVPQGDVSAMVEAVVALDRDRNELGRYKRAARAHIARAFSPEAHFARLADIVAECFAQPPPDPASVVGDPTGQAVTRLVARAKATDTSVVVYGAGMFGRKVVDGCLAAGVPVLGLLDSDPARGGMSYRGLVCRGPEAIPVSPKAAYVVGSMEFAVEIGGRIRAEHARTGLPSPLVLTCRD